MLQYWYVWVPVLLLAAVAVPVIVCYPAWRLKRQLAKLRHARATFSLRREWLEAKFMTLAAQSGKPRGLEWVNCEFDNQVRFARDRDSGNLRALVGVTISFRAIEGGGMEEVEAVSNLRAATTVFLYEDGAWMTEGRAIFNLNPEQTIKHFEHELEMVE